MLLNPKSTSQVGAYRLGICAFAWMGTTFAGCSSSQKASTGQSQSGGFAGTTSLGSGGTGGIQPTGNLAGSPAIQGGSPGLGGQIQIGAGGQGGSAGLGSTGGGSSSGGMGAADAGSDGGPGEIIEAKCGANDKPETGLQGGVYPGTVNCGLTLLSELPYGGHVQGSGHCAYVRIVGTAMYTGSSIKAYDIADPLKPVQTDEVVPVGGSESMRASTVADRAILVSGRGVYDVSNCTKMVKKGEIPWPSQNAMNGLYFAALSSHEIAISHDAKRVYSGLGFAIAHIEDLEHSDTWRVDDWACEMNKQSNFPQSVPNACDGPIHQDVGRQYSHSSDDNLEGTVWYGASQGADTASAMEPATARMVDISDPKSIKILDTLHEFPGHSMSWWRTANGQEFIMGANEGLGPADACVAYPRPTSLGNALDAHVVEVTGKKFGTPFILTLDVNRPEHCKDPAAAGANATITESTIYNKHGAAFVMIEYGGAGLRVFDLRVPGKPREVAYYNDRKGHVHSGVFYYDDARGIMLASGTQAGHVLMLEPQMIKALGLPYPTDPKYPYK